MNIRFELSDNCPCGSGLQLKTCCFKKNSWNKTPALIGHHSEKSNFSHDKCYANLTNDCSEKISREHLISEFILNNLGNQKAVKIGGLHWQKEGQVQNISKAGLVSKVLCSKHNEMLSPFDAEMGRLHATIKKYDTSLQTDELDEFSIFCGEDLEKWMLKTTCNYIVSNQIYSGEQKVECKMKEIYVDILFGNKPFPEGWGLYIDASGDDKIQHHNYLNLSFTVKDDTLRMTKLTLNGLTIYLLLERPTDSKKGIIYRPRAIEMKKCEVKKVMEISWQDKQYNQGVFLTYEKPITRTSQEWDKIIFKKKAGS